MKTLNQKQEEGNKIFFAHQKKKKHGLFSPRKKELKDIVQERAQRHAFFLLR